jgi:twitching motility two-component system response regulator PilH
MLGDTAADKAAPPTILVVDDARTIVRSFELMLARGGYHTLSGFDGEEAVALASRAQPDLILMDIVMPRMNGFEAMRVLRASPQTAGIPVIIVSGNDQPSDRAWAAKLGAKGFLVKPVNEVQLMATVSSVLRAARSEALRAALLGGPSQELDARK